MAQISNVRNDGNGAVTTGPKKVNSYNVRPVAIVATAAGFNFDTGKSLNHDLFNVGQTSASTDSVVLSPNFVQGDELWFVPSSACKILPGTGCTVNAGTATTQGITLAVGSTYRFLKTSSTAWICTAFAAAGTLSAPSPA